VKTDPNTDLILSQMRTTLATSQLPPEVNNYGIPSRRTLTAPLMLLSLNSPTEPSTRSSWPTTPYINLNDQLTRVPGIGSVQVFGRRSICNAAVGQPDQLAKLGITVPEIVSAFKHKTRVNPAGQVRQ